MVRAKLMVSQVLGVRLPVLLFPPGHVLLLSLFSLGKVFGKLSLLQRVPVVQEPVRWDDLSLVGTATRAVGN